MTRRGLFLEPRQSRAERGFALAPILYLLGLIGVGAGILFSSYSQILRSNQTMSNTLAAKNDLQGTATTLAATSWLSNDKTLLCPPLIGSNSPSTPSANCSTNSSAITVGQSFGSAPAGNLPANYASVTSAGNPVEAGVFAAGHGEKVLDPWGHSYVWCRWENGIGGANAIEIISAGPSGKIQTTCGSTVAGGDNLMVVWSTAVTQNRAAVWQTTTSGTSVTGAQFGATGTQVDISASGNVTVPGTLGVAGTTSLGTTNISGPLTAADITNTPISGSTGSFTTLAVGGSGQMTVDISGDINTGGTLGISGLSTLGQVSAGSSTLSYATITNNATVGGTLGVTGATTLGSTSVTDFSTSDTSNSSFFAGGLNTSTGKIQIGTTVAAVGSSAPLLTVGKGIGTPATYPFTVDQYGNVTGGTFSGSFSGNLTGSQSGGSVSATSLSASGATILSGSLTGTSATFSGTVTANSFSGTMNLGGGGGMTFTGVLPLGNGGTGINASSNNNLLATLLSGQTGVVPSADVACCITSSQMQATGVSAGTYSTVTVDSAGRVLSGTVGAATISQITDTGGEAVGVGTTTGALFTIGGNVEGNWTTSGFMVGSSKAAVNTLDVWGAQAIGTGYAGVYTAPTNGLIVQGNVGIGTNNPGTNALQVSGTVNATNFVGNGSGLTGIGTGNVNVGTQYQMAYYAANGSAVSGDSKIVTDSNNNLSVLSYGLGVWGTPDSAFYGITYRQGNSNEIGLGEQGAINRSGLFLGNESSGSEYGGGGIFWPAGSENAPYAPATLIAAYGPGGANHPGWIVMGGTSASGGNVPNQTNYAATGLTLVNSVSTGNATNPDMVFMTGVKGASGTTQATPTTALTLKGETQYAIFASNVGIGTTSPQSLLQAYGGEVQVGASSNACAGNNAGAIRYSGGTLYYCNASAWQSIFSSAGGSGGEVTGAGTTGYDALWTSPTSIGTGLIFESGGQIGIGTSGPASTLSVYNGNQSATLTNFTQGIGSAGINVMSGYTAGDYTPGIFWSTNNNNPTLPKAGIWTQTSASGSYLNFGTSNAYSTGITNQAMVIDYNGNVGIGTTSPSAGMHVFSAASTYANKTFKVTDNSGNSIITVTGDGRVFAGADSGRNSVLDINFAGAKTSGNLLTINDGTYTGTVSTASFSSSNPTLGIGGNNFGNAIQTISPTANGILNVVGSSVGIGTTSPATLLDVEQSLTTGTALARFKDPNNSSRIDLLAHDVGILGGSSGNYFTTLNLIHNGISVVDSGNTGYTMFQTGAGSINTNAISSGGVNNLTYSALTFSSNYWGVSTSTPAINFLVFPSSGSGVNLSRLQIFNGDSGAVVLQPTSGNVGIGSTSPANTLDVTGTGIHIASGTPGATVYQLYNNAGTLTWNGNALLTGGSGVTTFSAGTTGFTPNTATSGAVTLAGTLAIANGGTDATSQTTNGVNYYNGTSITSGTGFVYSGSQIGIGTSTPTAALTLLGTEALQFGTNYSTTGTQNDVAISGNGSVRYTGSGVATFNGIVAGANGQIIYLHNGSTSVLTLANQSASDTTYANQIVTGTGSNLTVASNSAVILQYDQTATNSNGASGAWRVIGGSGGGIPAGTTGQVQYNSGSGSFAANSNFTFLSANNQLVVGTGAATSAASTGTVAGFVMNVIPQAIANPGSGMTGGITLNSAATGQMAYYSGANAISGTSNLYVSGSNIGIGTSVATYPLSFSGGSAQEIWMQRSASGAGYNFTIQAGGGQSGVANNNGGNLILSGGISTGTGTSQIQFQTAPAGSGTADNPPATVMTILGSGNVGIGTANPGALFTVGNNLFEVNLSGVVTDAGETVNGTLTTNITGSTQCLHLNSSGVISGTGSDCGSGSGSGTVTSSNAGQVAYYQSTGTTVIGTSTMNIVGGQVGIGTAIPTNALTVNGNIDAMGSYNGFISEVPNSASVATGLNKLAKMYGGNTVTIGTTGDTDGMIGVVVGNAGTTGNAQIAIAGQAGCVFDSAPSTIGDIVTISSSTAGACHDSGTNVRGWTTSQTIGFVQNIIPITGSTYPIIVAPGPPSGFPNCAIGDAVISCGTYWACASNRPHSCYLVALSPTTLPNGSYNTSYSQTVTASGGVSPYTYSITSGSLPNGLSIASSTGVISGTPITAGAASFTVTATDTYSNIGVQAYTITISAPTITLSPTSISPVYGSAFSQTLTASGGVSPYTFAVTSGSLPSGLSLNSSTGAITGTPTAAGSYSFTVTATDTHSQTGSQAYSGTISAPTITLSPGSPLTAGTKNTAYSQTITASGGIASYTYAVTSGSLPAGLTLSSGGVISGTPTGTGTSSFTITATDAHSYTGSQAYLLTIAPAIAYAYITTTGAGSWTVPSGVTSITLQGIGGGGGGYNGAGAGAAYAASTITVTPGQVLYYNVGISDGTSTTGATWAQIGTNAAPSSNTLGILAPYGPSSSSNAGATAISSGAIGTTVYYGGSGGNYTNGSNGGDGGGGAAGVNGGGKNGGNCALSSGTGSGGGGGSNGGSSSAGSIGGASAGGTGGNGTAGTGGGATAGGTGTLGGGGGGATGSGNGGAGGSDTTLGSGYGSGGGGGGAITATAGTGGLYGGGGGGSPAGPDGAGAQGILVITY